MYRQIVIPKNTQLLLQLPAEFVGKKVEVIAFTVKDNYENISAKKRTWEEAKEFFKENAVDFSKIKKWQREDLYE